MIELPPDFIHSAPEGYSYEVIKFKRNVSGIWIVNHRKFSYTDTPPKSIWGFWCSKKKKYYSPINSKTIGKEVIITDTTAFTAMQLNLNPLERCMYQN